MSTSRQKNEKMKAYRKAYREANKEKINANDKAYYEAHKEEISARTKRQRDANKETIHARNKAYMEINKEKISAKRKAYREANKEKINAQKKAYREANKEKTKASVKAYKDAHREEIRASSRAYKARKKREKELAAQSFAQKRARNNEISNGIVKNTQHNPDSVTRLNLDAESQFVEKLIETESVDILLPPLYGNSHQAGNPSKFGQKTVEDWLELEPEAIVFPAFYSNKRYKEIENKEIEFRIMLHFESNKNNKNFTEFLNTLELNTSIHIVPNINMDQHLTIGSFNKDILHTFVNTLKYNDISKLKDWREAWSMVIDEFEKFKRPIPDTLDRWKREWAPGQNKGRLSTLAIFSFLEEQRNTRSNSSASNENESYKRKENIKICGVT